MKKSILIIGAGSGLSQGIAEKFGAEGFKVSLISRNERNLENVKKDITMKGVETDYATADAGNAEALSSAIRLLISRNGGYDVVVYNPSILKQKDILEETAASLTNEFAVNVAGALVTLQASLETLKANKGAFLLTGGALAMYPSPLYGSLSIGKAGLRSLAYQLDQRLKDDGIFVGLVSVAGQIDLKSETHSPAILADHFYSLYRNRDNIEINH